MFCYCTNALSFRPEIKQFFLDNNGYLHIIILQFFCKTLHLMCCLMVAITDLHLSTYPLIMR